jgi:hypothetical protein
MSRREHFMGLEYVSLAPGFVKEVLDVYENWEGKDAMPMKVKELMMVLQIEVSRRYNPGPSIRRGNENDRQISLGHL